MGYTERSLLSLPLLMLDSLNFTNRYLQLPDNLWTAVSPSPLEQVQLIHTNTALLKRIGLEKSDKVDAELTHLLACQPLQQPLHSVATVYSGHQFGQYNPQLGDGRALLIAETEHEGNYLEWQIKGSGLTPYSRMGDGRAVLRSTIREYLAQEAMAGLTIPTTRSLALATSQTPVYRETVETAATLIRTAPSFIRFGHFEYFFYTKQLDTLLTLVNFVIDSYYPECKHQPEPVAAFLQAITDRTAQLIAKWQAYGFCHGVMNTDNMSILGLTLDYGPFGFLDDFSIGHICNHSDHHGRYAYNQQVNIGLWNLNALAHSLSPFIETEQIKQSLQSYEPTYIETYRDLMLMRLGLSNQGELTDKLISELLQLLNEYKIDYTTFFRQLSHCNLNDKPEVISKIRQSKWIEQYWKLSSSKHQIKDKKQSMLAANPKYILRNHLAQSSIDKASQGDYSMIDELITVLQHPFDEHQALNYLAQPPKSHEKNLSLSCSS